MDRIRREAPAGWQSLVAVDADGLIVGHVLLSPCPVEDDDGERVGEVLALGPIAVLPEVQFRGVGSALMATATGLAVARAVPAIVLLGHPRTTRGSGSCRPGAWGCTRLPRPGRTPRGWPAAAGLDGFVPRHGPLPGGVRAAVVGWRTRSSRWSPGG